MLDLGTGLVVCGVGAQAPPCAQAFPKLSERAGAVLEGEQGSLKALLSPCFVKAVVQDLCWYLYL